jgi:hypothetical protein
MLLLPIILLVTNTISSLLPHTQQQNPIRSISSPGHKVVLANEPCGLLFDGSSPLPQLTSCVYTSICTPRDPLCNNNTNCTNTCVPSPKCNETTPCPASYMRCTVSSGNGVCIKRLLDRRAGGPNSPTGGACGMLLPGCPEGQTCIRTDVRCYLAGSCYGVCERTPAQQKPKYGGCGGRVQRVRCQGQDLCIDDPYEREERHSCGMGCDMGGMCVP